MIRRKRYSLFETLFLNMPRQAERHHGKMVRQRVSFEGLQ